MRLFRWIGIEEVSLPQEREAWSVIAEGRAEAGLANLDQSIGRLSIPISSDAERDDAWNKVRDANKHQHTGCECVAQAKPAICVARRLGLGE
jgi:hypothetical protein